MPLELKITGRETGIINPTTGLALELSTIYDGKKYALSQVTGGRSEAGVGLVLHLAPDQREARSEGPCAILLATNCEGQYAATGIKSYDPRTGQPVFYTLSSDGSVAVNIDPSAERAVRAIPRQLRLGR